MSLILEPVASFLHFVTGQTIEPDQLAFFVGFYICLAGAYLVKNKLLHSSIPKELQLYLIGLAGLWIYYFVWGWLLLLPLIEVTISYLMMKMLPCKLSTKCIFGFSMSFLSLCHIHIIYIRFKALSEEHSSDYTGPVMIMTQRITSLAFSIQDGAKSSLSGLSEYRRRYAVREIPTLPQYFAYMFSFTGVMCGPFAFYNDIMPWLEGKRTHHRDQKNEGKTIHAPPLSQKIVVSKISFSMIFICLYWIGSKSFPCRKSIDPSYISTTATWRRIIYLYISLFMARAKYYGAWLFADAIHNALGIGFNGYTDDGSPRWDLISNINIPGIELATGLKSYIDNWNIMTVKWIRHVSYDRLSPKYRTLASFLLSAFWHGFFPGYYIMFLTCHVYLLIQRKARRTMRPFFQTSPARRYFYEFVTLLATQMAIAYTAQAFVVLEWTGSIRFYKSLWFVGHVLGLLLFIVVPSGKRSPRVESSQAGQPHKHSSVSEQKTNIVSELASVNSHGHVRQR